MISAANQFNEPAIDGTEYVLVKVETVSTAQDEDEHSISSWDFKITGSNLILYSSASVVVPDPALDASLYSGGEAEGWLVFQVGTGETNLILVFDEMANWEENRYRFYAVDQDAKFTIPEELAQMNPSELGLKRSAPAPFGEAVITEDWEITIVDVLRGEVAFQMIQEANQFNDPPADGMEYLLVKVHVKYIGVTDSAQTMDSSSFKSTGSASTVYDVPSVVKPEPSLDVALYPGGEYDGWVALTVATDETDVILVFQPWIDWDDTNKRFMSLEE
jgi:hypothetical protein